MFETYVQHVQPWKPSKLHLEALDINFYAGLNNTPHLALQLNCHKC